MNIAVSNVFNWVFFFSSARSSLICFRWWGARDVNAVRLFFIFYAIREDNRQIKNMLLLPQKKILIGVNGSFWSQK